VIDEMAESLDPHDLEARWGDRLALAQRTSARSVEASSLFEREAALRATGRIHDEPEET
jgi:hypothetical protein